MTTTTRIAIIGAGPAGLAAGHELLAQGIHDFTIFEKAEAEKTNSYVRRAAQEYSALGKAILKG